MQDLVRLRTSFANLKKYDWYKTTNVPSFEELGGYGDEHEIVLETMSGNLERLRFRIVGRTISPMNTQRWIWGDVCTSDSFATAIVFEYDGEKIGSVFVTLSPKSLPLDICAKRSKKAKFAAEITAYDSFTPAR